MINPLSHGQRITQGYDSTARYLQDPRAWFHKLAIRQYSVAGCYTQDYVLMENVIPSWV